MRHMMGRFLVGFSIVTGSFNANAEGFMYECEPIEVGSGLGLSWYQNFEHMSQGAQLNAPEVTEDLNFP